MITVTIYINHRPIYTHSAVNKGIGYDSIMTAYLTDTGDVIMHKREDGAVNLAIKILETIKG